DPLNRRYRYAFTNCTHCGPRLSIIHAVPYDRAGTAMAKFEMCTACLAEYENPADRRFHAQPNCCPDCGPSLWLEDRAARKVDIAPWPDAIGAAAELLRRGSIIAIKGIGGFHLACDATNPDAVRRLRRNKDRYDKPFAMMARDLDVIGRYAIAGSGEIELLCSKAAPIVLLDRRSDGLQVAACVAPDQATLGFMLPYTPLHHLLLASFDRPLVFTSGNRSDEPQCTSNDDARERLAAIADYWLLHDRDILNRLDDSVVGRTFSSTRTLRRARGYAPDPLVLPDGFDDAPPVLAMGAELKNTFCLLGRGRAVVSAHTGDLEDARVHEDYRRSLDLYMTL
ncbi:MAG TPA: Sua5/YciO/YrdC/YwlC family protein, partial [Gammaproteobacteria bacterium]|nr:Sua5/YciO/YrdC/YwlC family protein [Gammaproteobacteria bacterium]